MSGSGNVRDAAAVARARSLSKGVSSMRRRYRKFIGAAAILVFVCVYALIAMAVAQGRLQEADKIWQSLYYVVVGLAWILPLMPLIRWMERPDQEDA
jgi:uncharacterized membrane protein YuzA (DUF378 family)